MFDIFKTKRGYTLVEVIVAVTLITTLVASYVNLFNGMLTSTTYFRDNMTAQMLAANKWKELDLVAYASLVAEAKATVGTTGFQREVILGADVDLGSGNHKRDVTINVYKTGSSTILYSAPKTVTSQGMNSFDVGHNFGNNGYQKYDNGLMEVWGIIPGSTGYGWYYQSFTVPFDVEVYGMSVTWHNQDPGSPNSGFLSYKDLTKNGFNFTGLPTNQPRFYRAIGRWK